MHIQIDELQIPTSPLLPVPAQGPDPAVSWSAISSPNTVLNYNTVEIGDINNDGNLDAAAGYDGLGLVIWLGDGAGNWQSATSPTGSGNYNDIKFGDINNDGKQDIVSSKQGGISAWHGDGTGNVWSSDIGPNVTGTFNAIHLNDLNLDGHIDIVAAAVGTGIRRGIQIFFGDGLNGWSNGDITNIMPLNQKFNGVFTSDFNSDGKPDIAASGDSGIKAWTGNGAGTWTNTSSGLPASGFFSDVELSDLDIDGDLDLIATGSNNNGVRVWKGNGAGVWALNTSLPFTGTFSALEVADVNIDGYLDILTSGMNTSQLVWTGDGAFNWYSQNSGLPSGNSYTDLSVGDINNDGHLDMFLLNSGVGISAWSSMCERSVNKWTAYPAPAGTPRVNDIKVHDINMDGKLDICYATQSNGVMMWTGNGNGAWTTFSSPISTGFVYAIHCADYNADGKPDLAATTTAGIKAWTGNGLGAWTSTSSGLPSTGTWYGLTIADCNADGKLDIISGSGTNNGIYVWKGNGVGIWTRTYTLPFSGTYYDIGTADINADGSIDIIAATGGLRVFLGNSNDAWTESSGGLPDSTKQYRYVQASDMNDDGKIDLAGTSETMGANSWQGLGNGQWASALSILSTHGSGIAVADFNIDGDMDACVGSNSSAGVRAMQQGAGTWTDVSSGLPIAGNLANVIFADINIDGRQDIVSYNNTAQTSRIWVGDYEAPPTPSFALGTLTVGWNLISLPLIPLNSSMPGVLQDLDGDTTWTVAKFFDPISVNNPWKSYTPLGPQNLKFVHECMAVWLYIPDALALGDGIIRIEGTVPTTSSIPLYAGWNLVGYPSATPRLASATLPPFADVISVYQAASPYVADHFDLSSVTMQAGNGYWVRVTTDCTWNLDY